MSDVYSSTAKKTFFCCFSVLLYHTWRPVVQGIKLGCSGVLFPFVSAMKYRYGRKAQVTYTCMLREDLYFHKLRSPSSVSFFLLLCVFFYWLYVQVLAKNKVKHICDIVIECIHVDRMWFLGVSVYLWEKSGLIPEGRGVMREKSLGPIIRFIFFFLLCLWGVRNQQDLLNSAVRG